MGCKFINLFLFIFFVLNSIQLFARSVFDNTNFNLALNHNSTFKRPFLKDNTYLIPTNHLLGMENFPTTGFNISVLKDVRINQSSYYISFGLEYAIYYEKIERSIGTAVFLKFYSPDPLLRSITKYSYFNFLILFNYNYNKFNFGIGTNTYFLNRYKNDYLFLSGNKYTGGNNFQYELKGYLELLFGIKINNRIEMFASYINKIQYTNYFKLGIKYRIPAQSTIRATSHLN